MGSLVWNANLTTAASPKIGIVALGSLVWDLWFGIRGLGSLVWNANLTIAASPKFGNVGLYTSVWDLWFGIFGLER